MNAKEEILELLEGDEIEAICLGDFGDEERDLEFYGHDKIEEALKELDFEFFDGFGAEEGYSLFVWSKNWIIIKSTYDGSEWYRRIPRNPDDKFKPVAMGC